MYLCGGVPNGVLLGVLVAPSSRSISAGGDTGLHNSRNLQVFYIIFEVVVNVNRLLMYV